MSTRVAAEEALALQSVAEEEAEKRRVIEERRAEARRAAAAKVRFSVLVVGVYGVLQKLCAQVVLLPVTWDPRFWCSMASPA